MPIIAYVLDAVISKMLITIITNPIIIKIFEKIWIILCLFGNMISAKLKAIRINPKKRSI
jgi:hypothetical protein